jgi:hypothetical protein
VTQERVIYRVIEALEHLGVPYMIAGSFASNLHGVPRMTQDADLVVDLEARAARRLVERLEPEFYASVEAALEAVRRRRMFNAIHLGTGFKVDLLIKQDRPFSAEELRRREPGPLANRQVAFATAEDTVLTKLEWARRGNSERQYEDALGILRVQAGRLDWSHLERWGAALGVTELLGRARRGEPYRT